MSVGFSLRRENERIDMYFVYYDDDYPNTGGVGFETFHKKDAAINFIRNRMQQADIKDISQYRLIKGIEQSADPSAKKYKCIICGKEAVLFSYQTNHPYCSEHIDR